MFRLLTNFVTVVIILYIMLAPRKKLWSTPIEVIDQAISLLNPSKDEIVYDIGAGDGNFIVRCHQVTSSQCIGVEIDEERAKEAKDSILQHGFSESHCNIICSNALEYDYSDGTCFFLYLVPRGLRLILQHLQAVKRRIRVVTYMSPLPDIESISVVKVSTAAHPEAKWPLYYYELNGKTPEL